MGLTQRDRDALRAVVKGRFEVLQGEVNKREKMLRNSIQEEVDREFVDRISFYEEEVNKLEAKVKELEREARDLIRKADREGMTIARYNKLLDVSIRRDIKIKDSYQIVQSRFEKIREEGGIRRNLRQLELEIIEDILTLDLGEDAKALLSKIPSSEDIVPLPQAKPALSRSKK